MFFIKERFFIFAVTNNNGYGKKTPSKYTHRPKNYV